MLTMCLLERDDDREYYTRFLRFVGHVVISLVRYVILAISVAKIDFIVSMASLGVK